MIERIFPHPAVLTGAELEHELLAAPVDRSAANPWLSFNFISSIDGAATLDGLSGKLGNPWDLRVFSLLRQSADVILVGAATIRAEGYGGELLSAAAQQWRHENWLPSHPPLAIVSGSLNLAPELEVFRDPPVRPLLLTLESAVDQAPRERVAALAKLAEIVTVGGDVLDPQRLLAELAARNFNRIHSEGGPSLLGTFAAAGAVDELNLTLSPLLVGGASGRISHGHAASELANSMELRRILKADSMLFLRYVRQHSS
ncbi:pyrimidine reductase family protein [Arthrobacter psychrolactophilus]|uniref:Pyrimidine reductase family protein n=1 Tax=Arthrobacter psychrolactophilus TaxID=92442 RepID=A0A2V5ITL9_9MICC|nr:pyrimidine reductase family protein [Arthrobacter psychrolactophilus]PYI39869.1 pyrimidine reductase family protein [Arthrobacter psychrolactophilus]